MNYQELLRQLDEYGDGHVLQHVAAKRIRQLENTVLALQANEALPLSLVILKMLEHTILTEARKLEAFGNDSLGNELRLARDKIQYVRSKLLEGGRAKKLKETEANT